jgi:hypothetical protein
MPNPNSPQVVLAQDSRLEVSDFDIRYSNGGSLSPFEMIEEMMGGQAKRT